MQVVTAALLAVYFLFFLSQISSEPVFSRIGNFEPTAYDLMAGIFLLFLVAYYSYRSRFHRIERLNRYEVFWSINAFALLTYLAFMSHLFTDENKTPAVAITVGYFATLGWIYTNYLNLRSQQRAHTMNVLLSLRTNSVLNEHRINFHKAYPPGNKVSESDLPKLKKESLEAESYNITSSNRATSTLDSIRYMTNLFEFICVGMRQGDLDETIIRMSLRGILVTYYDTVRPFIEDARKDDNGNLQPRIYSNYIYYVERFRSPQ